MKEKPLKFSGNFLYYDKKNLNGRIYKKEIAEEIVEQFNKMKEEGSPCFGELGHPSENQFGHIDLSNASREIEEIHLDEKSGSIKGTIRLLDTPSGNKVKEMMDNSGIIGLSCRSRGTGQVNENGEIENFKILSFDLVSGPDGFGNIVENDHLKLLDNE